ncbi:MAG: inositol monophosphatase [Candidatus Rokubacteria bacterium]|nr:inositol monophosphatase [Candidatus Rokubacteria bacterium]
MRIGRSSCFGLVPTSSVYHPLGESVKAWRHSTRAPARAKVERVTAFATIAIEAARTAGKLLRQELGGVRRISYKGASAINLVTEMDRRAERAIVEILCEAYPDHGILAEEGGAQGGPSEYRWIIDPLDGTTNYAHGLPVFCVAIALEAAGEIVLGVAYDPNLEELFVAERGGGASLNGEPIRVSETAALNESLLATGFPYTIRSTTRTNLSEFAAFSLRARAVRRIGSAVLDLCYVAAGRFDGYWELALGPWDLAAGSLVVREAGGVVTNVQGGPFTLAGPGVLATNGKLHPAMLEVLEAACGPARPGS